MPGKAIKIGPFKDGLNNVSLAGESKDSEVAQLINFEVALDGSLQCRPPIKQVRNTTDSTSAGRQNRIYGIFSMSSSNWYMVMAVPDATSANWTLALWTVNAANEPVYIRSLKGVTENNLPTGYVQMDGTAYFCMGPDSTISGFKAVINTAGQTLTDITTMPKGNCMIAYKSRLWIAGNDSATSKLSFSTIDPSGYKPDTWNNADFLNVAPGEGGFVTGLLALNSSILIFKSDGTWRFSYPSEPATGQVDKVSGSIGTASQSTIVEFENYVYVYDQGKLYELINNNFTQLNRFVTFSEDPMGTDQNAPGVDVSIFNRRILVRYFNTIYAYSVDSRTWSQWRTNVGTPGKLYELPADSSSTAASIYFAASQGKVTSTGGQSPPVVMALCDEFPLFPVETFTCFMRTKAYDYQASSLIKRLFWWGIDMKTNQTLKATLVPVSRGNTPTWGDLKAYTHGELAAGTWGNPLSFKSVSLNIYDGGDPSNLQTDNGRIFGKFTRSLRFRQLIFEVEMTSKGSLDSVCKIYSLSTYVMPKEKVVAKFN